MYGIRIDDFVQDLFADNTNSGRTRLPAYCRRSDSPVKHFNLLFGLTSSLRDVHKPSGCFSSMRS